MYENIIARLAADEAGALSIVKPLYCSGVRCVCAVFLRVGTLERVGRKACAGYQLLGENCSRPIRSNVLRDTTLRCGNQQILPATRPTNPLFATQVSLKRGKLGVYA